MQFKALIIGFWLIVPHAYGVAKGPALLGEQPPTVELAGSQGGLVGEGGTWSSSTLQGKLHVLFYVDPDLADANEKFTERLSEESFDAEHFRSVAVINMAATWKPNFAIRRALNRKQTQYPNTTYVMDNEKVLVDKWELDDEAYNVLLFDNDGKVIYRKTGTLSDEEIEGFVSLVRAQLDDK